MAATPFTISGFGDEIAADPAEQLAVLNRLGIRHLDLRGAWDRNVLDFAEADSESLRGLLAERGARVAMIASPIGKSQIGGPAAYEQDRLETAIRLAQAFETPLIRVFSYYHEGIAPDACRDEVIARLRSWATVAEDAGIVLLLENEGDLWGDTQDRCLDLFSSVDFPSFRFTLDTGNFAALGIASFDEAYGKLKPWLRHIQIKDVQRATHTTVPAGQGDGQIAQVLAAARADGYQGYLSLEPHLAVAGRAGGFSGAALFGTAADALRAVLADLDTRPQRRMTAHQPLPDVDAVAFDLLTALIDSWTLWEQVAADAPLGRVWRTASLRLITAAGAYVPYEEMVRRAAEEVGVPIARADDLLARWSDLRPWPEAPSVLARLAGRRLAIVTNCSQELADGARATGATFEVVMSAERAGVYKTDPRAYGAALDALGLPPERVLFVAGSAHDVPGAGSLGMPVYWSNRQHLAVPPGPPPLVDSPDLTGLLSLLGI